MLSVLLTLHPLGWKEKHFHLETLKSVPRLQSFYHILSRIVTPSHTLSPRLERKICSFTPFPRSEKKTCSFGNFKTSSQAPGLLSHLITCCHSFSHLITPSLGWEEKHAPCHSFAHLITTYPLDSIEKNFHLATLKLALRIKLLSHLALVIEKSFVDIVSLYYENEFV